MNKIPLTKEGEKNLREELNRLKLKRPKVIKAIAEAREHGDLKENAEYHAAREQQGLIEAKIKQETKATIRCLPLEDRSETGKCMVTGKPSEQEALFAIAY